MAVKKGKMKVSKLKHSNQVITKLKKQGKIKSQRHKKRKVVHSQPAKPQKKEHHPQDYSEDESIQGSDMMDMIEEEDLDFLMKGAADKSQTNSHLKNLHINDKKVGAKRKAASDIQSLIDEEKLENEYESVERPINVTEKKKKQLLPIKTKHGFMQRSIDREDYIRIEKQVEQPIEEVEETVNEKVDSEEELLSKEEPSLLNTAKSMSASEILLARHEELQSKKFKIGVLCSGLLESPENKTDNFFGLLNIMDEKNKNGNENLLTVRKFAAVSLLEVFKDILPDYQIAQQDFGETKLKKDTLTLHKYEAALLAHYKRYLQRLEKMSSVLVKKKGDTRNISPLKTKLGHVAITCLCDLLISHSYFNYSSNIAQMLVPFLNNRNPVVRSILNDCFKTVFKADKKGLISLMLVRKINQLVKTRSNDVNCEVLNCLLALRIKDINLDDEKQLEMKQKKQISHKQRLISMSKKERKRNKKLQELEKEMLETKAEENKQTKQQNLTEIVKVVFTIYFRILKRAPNSKLLSATLEGLSKFAHVMNLEYYSDLVNLLDKLLESEDLDLGYREQLYCVETVFTILSGQGDVLNIDPSRFYSHLYRNLLTIHAGKNHSDLVIILRAITSVLIKRRKKVSQQILLAFLKRISMLSTQVLHNGALGCLGIIKTVMQQSKQTEILLELDQELGSGQYDPHLMEPEYCNATSTALYELAILRRHYHPTVRLLALHIMNGLPSTGEGSLPSEISKLTPEKLFESYNGSQMAFKPSIPVPKKVAPKSRVGYHVFTHPNFEEYCKTMANKKLTGSFNFYKKFDAKLDL